MGIVLTFLAAFLLGRFVVVSAQASLTLILGEQTDITVSTKQGSELTTYVCHQEEVEVPEIDPNLITPQNYKVAFLGDSGSGENFQAVLDLIKAEGTQLVLHQGDMDYIEDRAGSLVFQGRVENTIPDIPYLGSDGNHDEWEWYIDFFHRQLNKAGIAGVDVTSTNYTILHDGLRIVFSEEGGKPAFIDESLKNDNQVWKICSWHKNQELMQIGRKDDEQGWADYDNCLKYGAIIATGHSHTYSRTKTLVNLNEPFIDPTCGETDSLCVGENKTFVFVNGLGGKSIRAQRRCLPATFPYGCNQEWASIYTADQGAEYGVLFIDFYVDGNPRKARGYFKNINGEIIDQFTITSNN